MAQVALAPSAVFLPLSNANAFGPDGCHDEPAARTCPTSAVGVVVNAHCVSTVSQEMVAAIGVSVLSDPPRYVPPPVTTRLSSVRAVLSTVTCMVLGDLPTSGMTPPNRSGMVSNPRGAMDDESAA